MSKLIMTRGLPASGKSFWAKQYQKDNPNTIRINKDELRAMLHDSKHSKAKEEFVLQLRDFIITMSLIKGQNVIVDDTNLNPLHEDRVRDLVNTYNNILPKPPIVEFEIKDFTDVPLETCLERDYLREGKARVGEKVIKQMYNQYLKPKPPVIEHIPGIPRAIMCDLDGTLCLFGDKNPYDRDFENDTINEAVRYILDGNDQYNSIIFISGRSDKFRKITQDWLCNHGFGENPLLFMRKEGDSRKDVIIKSEIYKAEIKGKYNILFVLDDRNQVVEFWRSQGLTCLQVAEGDF